MGLKPAPASSSSLTPPSQPLSACGLRVFAASGNAAETSCLAWGGRACSSGSRSGVVVCTASGFQSQRRGAEDAEDTEKSKREFRGILQSGFRAINSPAQGQDYWDMPRSTPVCLGAL